MMEKPKGVLARALYTNQPEAKNELFFRKGDILTVLETDFEGQLGWFMCVLRGQRGLCPGNYLELIEDKYSMPSHNTKYLMERQKGISESQPPPTTNAASPSGLETYDVPRSHKPITHTRTNSLPPPSEPFLKEKQQQDDPNGSSFSLAQQNPLDLYDVPQCNIPVITLDGHFGESLARKRRQYSSSDIDHSSQEESSSPEISKISPPPSTLSNSSSANCDLPPRANLVVEPPAPPRRRPKGLVNPITRTPSPPVNNSESNSISQRFSQPSNQSSAVINKNSIHSDSSASSQLHQRLTNFLSSQLSQNHIEGQSNRSSVQSESAESGIVMVSGPTGGMQDLYDVPRSTLSMVAQTQQPPSRPHSSMSMSSSGMGLSIANSDSKDSLDMYDVPRSVKSYVSHIETKYDNVQQPTRLRHMSNSNGGSTTSMNSAVSSDHRVRNSSCHSTYSGYGYGHSSRGPGSVLSVQSDFGVSCASLTSISSSNQNPPTDLYDVPRSYSAARNAQSYKSASQQALSSTNSIISASAASIQTNSSSDGDGSNGMLYDVPASFPKKVNAMSLCDSTETLSCQENLGMGDSDFHLELGASSSSLSAFRRPSLQMNGRGSSLHGSTPHLMANGARGSGMVAEVKILPLGPKAAVSVCERLRQEVVKSIKSILDHVKPKWRAKENLTEIMPEIRFSATRLNLAIKDLSDFCSRSLSNAKKLGDDGIQIKLHRLLTPLIQGSQIIQRDVDELDAYFWSVDRLSISQKHSANNKNGGSPPDALDQLVMCARSLSHDVTEIANFLAINSSALFNESDRFSPATTNNSVDTRVEDEPEDYDYVSLVPNAPEKDCVDGEGGVRRPPRPQLDWRDEQLLEFYSTQIGTTAPLLSAAISTFISAIQQNEPPKVFNGHLKYVILLAYKMLFAGDTVHRNLLFAPLKEEIENKANELNKSIVTMTEASKVATRDFPRIPPMQAIVTRVYETTAAATQLKKVIFNATCALR